MNQVAKTLNLETVAILLIVILLLTFTNACADEVNPEATFKTRMGKTVDVGLCRQYASKVHPQFKEYFEMQKKIAIEVTKNGNYKKRAKMPHTNEIITIYGYTSEDENKRSSYWDVDPPGFSPNDKLTINIKNMHGSRNGAWSYRDNGLNGPGNCESYADNQMLNSDNDYIVFSAIKGVLPKSIEIVSDRTNTHQKNDKLVNVQNIKKHLYDHQEAFVFSEFPHLLPEERRLELEAQKAAREAKVIENKKAEENEEVKKEFEQSKSNNGGLNIE